MTKDPAAQGAIVGAAKGVAMATTHLVTVSKVATASRAAHAQILAPTLSAPLCQEQVGECARAVADAVEAVVTSSQVAAPRMTD